MADLSIHSRNSNNISFRNLFLFKIIEIMINFAHDLLFSVVKLIKPFWNE